MRTSLRKRFWSILFWSILSAAFIGPGTVTTAAKAGASFGLSLLWALTLSTIATILLQEAAARITLASGKSLGAIIQQKYRGAAGHRLKLLLFLSILIGCAAYQAGNLLGALAGLRLIWPSGGIWLLLLIGCISFYFLWVGNFRKIGQLLGMIVALMGLAFLLVAFQAELPFSAVLKKALLPQFPTDSALLIIGLIGTTIVPYNLFLASGISQGQDIGEMRFGLVVAILLGGIISMAVLLVGTQISGDFSFEALAVALEKKLGAWASWFFGIGLFIAGLSSSITAPLAAAVTAGSLYGNEKIQDHWHPKGRNFRIVWMGILLFGLLFGLLQVKPIPIIILAQAINGTLLPIVATFLILIVNDRAFMGHYTNPWWLNLPMLLIVGLVTYLGLNNFSKALLAIWPSLDLSFLKWIGTLGLSSWLVFKLFFEKKDQKSLP